jgi:hypothetical protein
MMLMIYVVVLLLVQCHGLPATAGVWLWVLQPASWHGTLAAALLSCMQHSTHHALEGGNRTSSAAATRLQASS